MRSSRWSSAAYISLHLPTSPYISPHLPTPPYIPLHPPISPYVSLCLPISPHISERQVVARSGSIKTMKEQAEAETL